MNQSLSESFYLDEKIRSMNDTDGSDEDEMLDLKSSSPFAREERERDSQSYEAKDRASSIFSTQTLDSSGSRAPSWAQKRLEIQKSLGTAQASCASCTTSAGENCVIF